MVRKYGGSVVGVVVAGLSLFLYAPSHHPGVAAAGLIGGTFCTQGVQNNCPADPLGNGDGFCPADNKYLKCDGGPNWCNQLAGNDRCKAGDEVLGIVADDDCATRKDDVCP